MFKKLAVSAIASVIVLTPMMAKAEWVTIGETSEIILSVDSKIRVINEKTVFYWQQVVFKVKQPNKVKEMVTYNAVNCDLMALKTHRAILYNDQGEVITQEKYEEPLDWEYSIPGSRQQVLLQKVCSF
ncbi:MAG: surface-adhesin E family protein [Nostoc sp.]